jgi:hypothetical protein
VWIQRTRRVTVTSQRDGRTWCGRGGGEENERRVRADSAQGLFEEIEYARIQRQARERGLTMAQWVREAVREAYRRQPAGDLDRKLGAVRAAVAHEFPTADIDEMLEEIERGYLDGVTP